tara:strand:- start:467 stop:1333 length:867 start_codon:yes stop_codon:yes gene_type:complete
MKAKKKVIAISGSNGVLGKKFINKFNKYSYQIIDFDICNSKKLKKWINTKKFDAFIHLAAIVPLTKVKKNKLLAYRTNFLATKTIVDSLIKYKNKKNFFFFYASTSHVYKTSNSKIKENAQLKPISYYATTKYLSEKYILKKMENTKINYSIGRIFSFTDYGQHKSFLIPSIFNSFLEKKKIIKFSDLNQYRDFIATSDIVTAINCLFRKNAKGIFNIGSGKKYFLKNLVLLIKKKIFQNQKVTFFKMKKGKNLVANNLKISKLGWKTKYTIDDIIYEYYKNYKINEN